MGEKFSANPVTGTASMSIPLPLTAGRGGVTPSLALSYDSGAGNGPFGLGWRVGLPSVRRKTDKGLPRYLDEGEQADTYVLSDAEDLVPLLEEDGGTWGAASSRTQSYAGQSYTVTRYRPRIEGAFSLIERWKGNTDRRIWWRTISRDNAHRVYGRSDQARVADPDSATRVFEWLLEEESDALGNVISYQYKAEDRVGIVPQIAEQQRGTAGSRVTYRYLKRVSYGNTVMGYNPDAGLASGFFDPAADPAQVIGQAHPSSAPGRFLFHLVFDYGEHDTDDPELEPAGTWTARPDAFSSFRSGFDLRCYRLCRRVLMLHSFTELREDSGTAVPVVVRSLDLVYTERPTTTTLEKVQLWGWKWDEDSYDQEVLPETLFTYQQPVIDETVHLMEGLEDLPGGLDLRQWRFVDLDGEGLTGLLTEQGGSLYYKRNEGAGVLAPARQLPRQPSLSINGPGTRLVDLDGDGNLDVVVMRPGLSGFMARSDEQKDGWEPFRSFRQVPTHSPEDPNVRLIDLDGDGHADLLVTEEEALTWYPSEAREGFAAPQRRPQARREETGPRLLFSQQSEQIFLADMTGDGLTDLVRIRNGRVDYWPNKGYGRFGARVTMKGAPLFDKPDQFDPSRIRLADVDGSGPTDLLYLGRTGVQIWFNQSGNGFSEATTLTRFPSTANPNDVQVADLLGDGTACLVWSSPLLRESLSPLRYVRLMAQGKPWLLTSMNNGLGRTTTLTYTPSTQFYLEDRRAGTPWATRLPFPVHCLSRVESYDEVTGWRFANRYAYHHGYFDGPEREFRGFGMVEQWDTETFSDFAGPQEEQPPVDSGDELIEQALPIRTRTWFHTGAWKKQGTLTSAYEAEYFQEDEAAHHLPPPILPEDLSPEETQQALRALRGQMLRQEVYAEDGTGGLGRLYSVTEQTFTLKQLQPAQGEVPGVFHMVAGQTLSFSYDLDLTREDGVLLATPDPRVSHTLTLAVDPYGNVERSAAVSYRRRVPTPDPPVPDPDDLLDAEQKTTRVVVTETILTNQDTLIAGANVWRLGVPNRSRVWEFVGEVADSLSSDGLTDDTALVNPSVLDESFLDGELTVLSFEETPATTSYKRLLGTQMLLYWQDDLIAPVPLTPTLLNAVGKRALVYQKYALAYTADLLSQLFGSRVNSSLLLAGGYVELGLNPLDSSADSDDHWWIPSGRTTLDPDAFFHPTEHIDPFGNTTTLTWDTHDLTVEAVASPAVSGTTLTVTAAIDYRVVAPHTVTDPNGTETTATFDALGRVLTSAIRNGTTHGDGSGAHSAEFTYNTSSLPASVHTKVLKAYGVYATIDGVAPWQESYAYCDGGGNVVQTKVQVAPGLAPERDEGNELVFVDDVLQWAEAESRWVGTGRVVVDNKGNVVKQYEPFFSSIPDYEDEDEVVEWGVSAVMAYDPLGRNIQVTLPDGFVRSWRYGAWKVEAFDEEDNRTGSPFENTPVVTHLDAQGRVYKQWEFLDSSAYTAEDPEDSTHVANLIRTRLVLDLLGNPLQVIASLQTVSPLDYVVQIQEFDVLGRPAFTGSADEGYVVTTPKESNTAGQNWMFPAVDSQPMRTWRSGSLTIRRTYDALRRPTQTWANQGAGEKLKELMIYGEFEEANPTDGFQLGRLSRVYDGAGLQAIDYDFKGQVTVQTRRILADPTLEPDWAGLETETSITDLELAAPSSQLVSSSSTTDVFVQEVDYDALGRPTEKRLPDVTAHGRSSLSYTYDAGGRLYAVSLVAGSGGSPEDVVEAVTYNARGQREQIDYGNGTTTTYSYDSERFWLTSLKTILSSDPNNPLQDLSYTRDAVGNILTITDAAQQLHFFQNALINANQVFTYDAKYRLTSAKGRERLGLIHSAEGYGPPNALPFNDTSNNPRRYQQFYNYDHAGNIIQMGHKNGAGSTIWTRDYTYAYQTSSPHLSNQLRQTVEPVMGGTLTHTYTHNLRGAMVGMGHLQALSRDWRDQLSHVQINLANTKKAYYRYGSDGQRVTKVVKVNGSNDVLVMYCGDFEVHREFNSSDVLQLERETVHVMDDQQRVLMVETKTKDGGTTPSTIVPRYRYQYGNHLGSASMECDNIGNLITYEEYHPYGTTAWWAEVSSIQVSRKRYRYVGKEKDNETGLSYHGARYYLPWLGRWCSVDPMKTVDGHNLYCYSMCDPVNKRDVNGFDTDVIHYTSPEAVKSIAADKNFGYNPPNWLGDGVYFATPSHPFPSMGPAMNAGNREVVALQGTVDTTGFTRISAREWIATEEMLEAGIKEQLRIRYGLPPDEKNIPHSKAEIAAIKNQYWTDRFKDTPGVILEWPGGRGTQMGDIILVTESGLDRIGSEFRVIGRVIPSGSGDKTDLWRINRDISSVDSSVPRNFEIASVGNRKLINLARRVGKLIPGIGIYFGMSSAAEAAEAGNYPRAVADVAGSILEPIDYAVIAYDVARFLYENPPEFQYIHEQGLRNPDGSRIDENYQLQLDIGPKY